MTVSANAAPFCIAVWIFAYQTRTESGQSTVEIAVEIEKSTKRHGVVILEAPRAVGKNLTRF